MQTNGDLAALARAVVDLDGSVGRGAGEVQDAGGIARLGLPRRGGADRIGRDQRAVYASLAHRLFSVASSPAGWPDTASSWSGADAVMKRLEWANAVSQRISAMGSP